MKDNYMADVSHTDDFEQMYQEIVKKVKDKYNVKSEHPKTEEEAKDFAAKVLGVKEEIPIPDNYEVWDDKGNVIHTSKIIIREKKKEYPKSYEECAKVLLDRASVRNDLGYKADLLVALQRLLVCRDAYWKIAGDEMGLGKPWEPDWKKQDKKYIISVFEDTIIYFENETYNRNTILAFPTEEMRDAFYANFKELIEECKELL